MLMPFFLWPVVFFVIGNVFFLSILGAINVSIFSVGLLVFSFDKNVSVLKKTSR